MKNPPDDGGPNEYEVTGGEEYCEAEDESVEGAAAPLTLRPPHAESERCYRSDGRHTTDPAGES